MSRLLLVRHGAVPASIPPKYIGQTDIPLSIEGVRQARRIRTQLANDSISAVYSSDLKRAIQTAIIIATPNHIPIVLHPELREIDFGEFEGMTYDEIVRSYPESSDIWNNLSFSTHFPGGESLASLAARIDRFISVLANLEPSSTSLVVAHGGSLRMLICRLLKLDLSKWWSLNVGIASVTALEMCESKTESGIAEYPIFDSLL